MVMGVAAIDTFCNDYAVSADDMVLKKVNREVLCRGLAFMGLARSLNARVLLKVKQNGAAN